MVMLNKINAQKINPATEEKQDAILAAIQAGPAVELEIKNDADLGIIISDDCKMFNCIQVTISDIVNCEIEVLDFIPGIKTLHGDNRCLVHYRHEGMEGKFFTSARNIKESLEAVNEDDFPFLATIKSQKCGTNKIYIIT